MREKLIHKLDVIALYLLDNNRAQAMRVVRETQALLGATSEYPLHSAALPSSEDLGDVSDHLLEVQP
jgi:hypothetical protein